MWRPRARSVAAIGALVLSAVILACCFVGHHKWRDELAYDGPYDTPPVTFYYPATSNNENTLGFTWNNADMQNTEVTYVPGMMTDNGIATSTVDTIGFPVGANTWTHPFGDGVEYQDREEMIPLAAKAKRPLHPATLKFIKARDEAARFQSLADSNTMDGVDALRKSKVSGTEDLLTKKLDAAFAAMNGDGGVKLAHKQAGKSYSDMDEELEDMRLSDDLLNAAGSVGTKGRHGRKASRGIKNSRTMKAVKLQKLSYSVDPYEINANAETSAKVEVNGDTAMQMSYGGQSNIAGTTTVNLAKSDDSSGPKWSTGDVQLQSPALIVNQVPPRIPAPGPMMHMPMYPGQPGYSFHVNHGGLPPSVKGEIWSYSDESTNKNGPSSWGKLRRAYGVCSRGVNQSPINVELNIKRDDNLKLLRWLGPNNPYQATVISPLYKNVLTIEGLKGSMQVSGLKMELKRATIHTPSEHKLLGRRMPGEIQFEHEGVAEHQHVKVIVSVFLDIGVTTAPFLKNFMESVGQFLGTYNVDGGGSTGSYMFPTIGQDVKPPIWFNTALMAEDVLGAGSNYANYFTYYGSLTRPPCTEGVTWIILKTPILISPDHHSDLLYEQGYTARPTQQMQNRQVYDTGTGTHGSGVNSWGGDLGFQSPDPRGW